MNLNFLMVQKTKSMLKGSEEEKLIKVLENPIDWI